jgi:phosphatidylethanolamine-binding protein (PEBP) family uncharacterized protein
VTPRTLLAVTALAAAVATGCNDDGRTLAPAPPTTTSTVAAPAITGGGQAAMRLSSLDVVDGVLDPRLTCDGADEPPTLGVIGVPAGAVELAVAVVDVDAGGAVHWLVAGLPPTIGVLDPAALPETAIIGRTEGGELGWEGPCPHPDDGPHRYELRLYATAEPTGLARGVDGREAVEVLEQAAMETATLTATDGG